MFNKVTVIKSTKVALTLFSTLFVSTLFTEHVHAVKQVTVRLSQPKSPTNQTNFNLTFTALDLSGRAVMVRCLKQGPSDAGFTQFGSDQNFANGGNSGTCTVNGIFGAAGTYNFKAEARAGDGTGDNFDDETISVIYDNSGPGDVKDYNKTKSACEYSIHFKTADDGGATVKVEVYRSDVVPFNADSGSRIQSIAIGSNTEKNTTDTPPDCSKSYYYAIRAFDSAGNGSALVGDNVSTITVINPTLGVQPADRQGAIPVSGGSEGGSVLGEETLPVGATGANGEALGETSPSAELVNLEKQMDDKTQMARNLVTGGAILLIGALAYVFFKKRQNQTPTV